MTIRISIGGDLGKNTPGRENSTSKATGIKQTNKQTEKHEAYCGEGSVDHRVCERNLGNQIEDGCF